mgnify:FL=1
MGLNQQTQGCLSYQHYSSLGSQGKSLAVYVETLVTIRHHDFLGYFSYAILTLNPDLYRKFDSMGYRFIR